MYTVRKIDQSGMVLVFVVLVLFLLGLLVTAGMRGSLFQLRMARNLEVAVVERQQALGEIERILQQLGLDAPEGPRGHLNCTSNHSGENCHENSLPADEGSPGPVQSHVLVVQPDRPPPRVAEEHASSSLAYRAVHYEVGAVSGGTSLVQGVLILVPESRP
jgi:hypothetical protein